MDLRTIFKSLYEKVLRLIFFLLLTLQLCFLSVLSRNEAQLIAELLDSVAICHHRQ